MIEILKIYSARKNEFEQLGNNDYSYQSKYIKGYVITFAEEVEGQFKTGRIKISHTQDNGKITFYDIWERDKENNFHFRFRNPLNCPLADRNYIKDLEKNNEQLKQIILELKEQQSISQKLNNNIKNEEYEYKISKLEEELKKTKESMMEILSQKLNSDNKLNELQKELESLKIHNARGAGRKISEKRLNTIKQVKKLIEQGKSDKQIITILGVSPATYYRYKKEIS